MKGRGFERRTQRRSVGEVGRAPDFFLSFSPVVSSQALFPWQPSAGDRETALKEKGTHPHLKRVANLCVCEQMRMRVSTKRSWEDIKVLTARTTFGLWTTGCQQLNG